MEQIEAEFWRIVESPEEVVESLYGQDVDSGHHGSGFPLPLWRRRLLEQHLAKQAAAAGGGGAVELPNYTTGECRWAGNRTASAYTVVVCTCMSMLRPACPPHHAVHAADAEREYAEHPWNINNLPRCADSVLRCVRALKIKLLFLVLCSTVLRNSARGAPIPQCTSILPRPCPIPAAVCVSAGTCPAWMAS